MTAPRADLAQFVEDLRVKLHETLDLWLTLPAGDPRADAALEEYTEFSRATRAVLAAELEKERPEGKAN